MIVLGTHCNFFIVFPIRLKNCRSNGFFFFTRQNVRARKIGCVSDVFRALTRPIGIGYASCPDLTAQFQTMTIEFVIFVKDNFS